MSQDIILHQWDISPFCQKVARALRFKDLEYRTVDYNGLLGAKVMRLSKVGKVPVLEVDGKRIQDSTRIVQWLAEAYPEKPLFLAEPGQRALVDLWGDWADELLYWYDVHFRANDPKALAEAIRLSCIGRPAAERIAVKATLKLTLNAQLKSQGLGRMRDEDIHAEFLRLLDRVDTALAPTGWLVGDRMSMADIAVASQLLEVERTSDPLRPELWKRPHLAKQLKAVQAI